MSEAFSRLLIKLQTEILAISLYESYAGRESDVPWSKLSPHKRDYWLQEASRSYLVTPGLVAPYTTSLPKMYTEDALTGVHKALKAAGVTLTDDQETTFDNHLHDVFSPFVWDTYRNYN